MQITRKEIDRLQRSAAAARTQLKRAREEGREVVQTTLTAAGVSGTAFAIGVVNGRYANPEVMGVPLGLVVGTVGHVGGLLLGRADGGAHLHAIANGGLGAYLSDLGRTVGQRMAEGGAMLPPGT